MVRVAIFSFLLLLCANVWCSEQRSTDGAGLNVLQCMQSGDDVVIDFGSTRHPTHFGVQTPNDQFVYLRYPPRGVDVLGERYRAPRLRLDTNNLTGVIFVNEKPTTVKVFETPGRYTLRFRDATRLAFEDHFVLSCEITIGGDTRSGDTSNAAALGASYAILTVANVSEVQYAPSCMYTDGCGSRCCAFDINPGFCYCNSCCVARPPGSPDAIEIAAVNQQCENAL